MIGNLIHKTDVFLLGFVPYSVSIPLKRSQWNLTFWEFSCIISVLTVTILLDVDGSCLVEKNGGVIEFSPSSTMLIALFSWCEDDLFAKSLFYFAKCRHTTSGVYWRKSFNVANKVKQPRNIPIYIRSMR